ncbi:MAG: TolC family protein [Deltaproteobacteria bacterium]|nr:TolC family protein [Deltaproteobacteria bacterium]
MPINIGIKMGVVLTGICCLISACAATDPQGPFTEVKETVQKRTGRKIEWPRTSEAKTKMSQRVNAMLADGLTLDEAIAIGLANNRRIQGIYHQLGVAQADLAQSQLLDNPHVGFAYLGSSSNLYKLELEAVINILSLFMIPLRKALAEAQLAQAQHRISTVVLTHIYDIKRVYLRVQALQAQYRLLERVLMSSEAAYEMAQRMRDAGNITKLELLSRRSLVDEDRLTLSSASMELFSAREQLNRLLGLYGSAVTWEIDATLPPLPANRPVIEDVEKQAVSASVDVALTESNLRVAARELGITDVTSIIPELGVGAAFEREADGMWLGGPALELQLPIFDPGHAKRSRARALLAERWEAFTATAVDVRSQAREALRRLKVAWEQCHYYETSFLPLRQAMTKQAQRRYNGMFLSVFELLMIKRMEIRASMGSIDKLKDYWMAQADMDEILAGKLPDRSGGVTPVSMMTGPGQGAGRGGH